MNSHELNNIKEAMRDVKLHYKMGMYDAFIVSFVVSVVTTVSVVLILS